jgi:hypothetical protein
MPKSMQPCTVGNEGILQFCYSRVRIEEVVDTDEENIDGANSYEDIV